MVRGVYIQRAPAERMTVAAALKSYLKEVTPTKRPSTQVGEHKKAQTIINHLGKYSLAALSPDIVADFRDMRLAGDEDAKGVRKPRSNNTVRLELALLGHLLRLPSIGLPINLVANIRRPALGAAGVSVGSLQVSRSSFSDRRQTFHSHDSSSAKDE